MRHAARCFLLAVLVTSLVTAGTHPNPLGAHFDVAKYFPVLERLFGVNQGRAARTRPYWRQNLLKRVPMASGELEILKGIDLEIKDSESVAIVGASGSGKSTLLGLLAGLDEASEGKVWVDGVELGALDEDERAQLRADKVGFGGRRGFPSWSERRSVLHRPGHGGSRRQSRAWKPCVHRG